MAFNQSQHPLLAPTVSGTQVTVDAMLQNPTRVTRLIADLTLQRFIVDRIFANAGGVTGGAVLYDQATFNDLYSDRDVQRVEPGTEFPVISSSRVAPKVAAVEKWGGKVFVTDEAKDRNNSALFMNEIRRLSNTIIRKVNQRAIAELDLAATTFSRTFAGRSWGSVVTAGSSASSNFQTPMRDIALAQEMANVDELGVEFDLWLLNPVEYMNLQIIYGDRLGALLSGFGIDVYPSNRVPAGTAYAVASQQVGELRLEKPLTTETWREQGLQQTWVQSDVRPVVYVTNPYSVLKVTGLT